MEMVMMPREALQQLGKLVAKDIAAGRMSEGSRKVGLALASEPDSVLLVLDLLLAEGRKKRPNDGMMTAFGFMISEALEALRMQIENQQQQAAMQAIGG